MSRFHRIYDTLLLTLPALLASAALYSGPAPPRDRTQQQQLTQTDSHRQSDTSREEEKKKREEA